MRKYREVKSLDVREVEEILGCYRSIRPPHHMIFTQETVTKQVDGSIYYRGLQPRFRGDVMVLTKDAIDESVVHEALHANFGVGEAIATPLAKIFIWRARILKQFPLVKSLVQREVRYQKCPGCEEFKELHTKYAGRAEHYKL